MFTLSLLKCASDRIAIVKKQKKKKKQNEIHSRIK